MSIIAQLRERVAHLEGAIRTHRAYWEERTSNSYDDALYAALDNPIPFALPCCKGDFTGPRCPHGHFWPATGHYCPICGPQPSEREGSQDA